MRLRDIMIAVLSVSLFLAGWLLLRRSIIPSPQIMSIRLRGWTITTRIRWPQVPPLEITATRLQGGIGTKIEEMIDLDPETGMPLKP